MANLRKPLVIEVDWIALAKGARKTIPKNAQKLIRARAKEVVRHFKKDGWDVWYSFYVEDLMRDLLGFHPETLFLAEIQKAGLKFTLKSKSTTALAISKDNSRKRRARK